MSDQQEGATFEGLVADAMSRAAALTAVGVVREQIALEIEGLRDMHAGMDESWREGMAFAARIARSGRPGSGVTADV